MYYAESCFFGNIISNLYIISIHSLEKAVKVIFIIGIKRGLSIFCLKNTLCEASPILEYILTVPLISANTIWQGILPIKGGSLNPGTELTGYIREY
jgi:hypothetical protein